MMKSSAVINGSFAPTVQLEKLEIHIVFRRFSSFHSCQNLSPITLADFIVGYLSPLTSQCSCRDKNIAPGGTRTESFQKADSDWKAYIFTKKEAVASILRQPLFCEKHT